MNKEKDKDKDIERWRGVFGFGDEWLEKKPDETEEQKKERVEEWGNFLNDLST